MSALRSITWLWLGSLTGAAAALISQVILARGLGPAEYGEFVAALTIITILAPLAAFGVPAFLLRAYGQEGNQAKRWISPAYFFSVLSTTSVVLVIIAWALLASHPITTSHLLILLAIHIPAQAMLELTLCKHQLDDRYRAMGIWQAAPHLVRAALLAALVVAPLSANLENFTLYFYALAYIVPSVMLIIFSRRELYILKSEAFMAHGFGQPSVSRISALDNIPGSKAVFRLSAPFGFGTLLHLVYSQSGIVFLRYLDTPDSAAILGILVYILSAVYLFPSVMFQRYIQKSFHILSNNEAANFRSIIFNTTVKAIVSGIGLMLIIWLAAPALIPMVFGESYSIAGSMIVTAGICIPFRIGSIALGTVLQTRTHVDTKIKCMLFVALANIVLQIILVPSHGISGAIYVTIATEIMLFLLYGYFVRLFFWYDDLRSAN